MYAKQVVTVYPPVPLDVVACVAAQNVLLHVHSLSIVMSTKFVNHTQLLERYLIDRNIHAAVSIHYYFHLFPPKYWLFVCETVDEVLLVIYFLCSYLFSYCTLKVIDTKNENKFRKLNCHRLLLQLRYNLF